MLCFSQELDLDVSASEAQSLIGWLRRRSKLMKRMKRIQFLREAQYNRSHHIIAVCSILPVCARMEHNQDGLLLARRPYLVTG